MMLFRATEYYRPLRLALFVYEVLRLVILAFLFVEWRAMGERDLFPVLLYAAPNALFPLMALFLLARLSQSGAYAPLYAAGKIIALVTALFWCIFSGNDIINALMMDKPGIILILEGVLGIFTGDVFSAVLLFILIKKLNAAKPDISKPAAVLADGGN
jgi:hypothetical protein